MGNTAGAASVVAATLPPTIPPSGFAVWEPVATAWVIDANLGAWGAKHGWGYRLGPGLVSWSSCTAWTQGPPFHNMPGA